MSWEVNAVFKLSILHWRKLREIQRCVGLFKSMWEQVVQPRFECRQLQTLDLTSRLCRNSEVRSSGLSPVLLDCTAKMSHTAAIKPRHSGPEWLTLLGCLLRSGLRVQTVKRLSLPLPLPKFGGDRRAQILWLYSIPMGRLSWSWAKKTLALTSCSVHTTL